MNLRLMIFTATLCILACFTLPAGAEINTQVIFTANWDANHTEPQLDADGYTVAWPWKGKIDYWDGHSIKQIGHSATGAEVKRISIHNGTLAWIGKASSSDTKYSVFYWNGTFDQSNHPHIEKISSMDPGSRSDYYAPGFSLSLYNGKIAWISSDGSDGEVYLWDGTYVAGKPHIVQISNDNYPDTGVSMANGMIAWTGGAGPVVRYWKNGKVHELNGSSPIWWYDTHFVSTSNGGIAWKEDFENSTIKYWDGTFSNGTPNIITVVPHEEYLWPGDPSLRNGKISYSLVYFDGSAYSRQIYYWDGATAFQLNGNIGLGLPTSFFTPAPPNSGYGVAYIAENPTSGKMEIRFATSTGHCI